MNNFEDLKSDYINAAKRHGESSELGNYKLSNKHHDILVKIYKQLCRSNSGKLILKELLDHSNVYVRMWAATHSLPYFELEAKNALEEIKKNNEYLKFDIETILDEWKNGNLKLDYDKDILNTANLNEDDDGTDLEIYNKIISSKEIHNEENYIKSLNSGIQMVYETLKLETEVQNGGFNQYFWNALPDDALLARRGYELLAAGKFIELLDEAVEIFMKERATHEKNIRENTPESFMNSSENTKLDRIDKKFLILLTEENPSIIRNRYISEHLDEFDLKN